MSELLDRLAAVAARHPDATAILDDEGALSYRALLAAVDRQADELRALGAQPGSLVALSLPRGRSLVVAMLAVWNLRASFVPLDPSHPLARRRELLRESRAWPVLGDDGAPRPSEPRHDPDLAGGYVIYTSGSTGRPKGVRVSPRGLVPMLDAQIAAFGLGPGKRALWMLSPAFDASLSDIGTALLSGATLCPVPVGPLSPDALRALITRHAITHADVPPSLLALLAPLPPSLETVIIGGEVCPPAVVREQSSLVRLLNVYGPTEATVCTSLVVCTPAWTTPRLGLPLPHVVYRVLDDRSREVPPGHEGELFIAGPALALGYLDRPELEAERFVWRDGVRLYRTGDRVRLRDDGEPVFVGRVDRQIKLRGQLLAPEEVEATLGSHPSVQDVAVVVHRLPRPPRPPRELLVAHVVLRDDTPLASLRAHLQAHLPGALVPLLAPATALPRGPTGKVDLDALAASPLPARSPAARPPTDHPSADLLVALFADVLGLPPSLLGQHDDFFALGGDSFTALELLAAASSYGLSLSTDALYRTPTPATLATSLASPALTVDELREASPAGSPARTPPAGRSTSPPAPAAAPTPPPALVAPTPPPAPPPAPQGEGSQRVNDTSASRTAFTDYPCSSPSPCGAGGGGGGVGSSVPRLGSRPGGSALLLTGATGFLGSRLLAALLARTSSPLHVLVRAPDDADAHARVARALGRPLPARVHVWRGDTSQPRFGLSPDDWQRLCASTHTLVHSAARLHLLAPLAELTDANVTSCREALRWREQRGGEGMIHHVSTLSVLVATDHPDAILDERSDPRDARRVHGGYAQSKWLAEDLLRRAGGCALHRLGLLTGDRSTGRPAPGCQLAHLLRGLASLGVVPAGDHDALRVDITPVDHAASAVAGLLALHPEVPDIYHVSSRHGVSLSRLLAALRSAGHPCRVVSADEFRHRWREATRGESLATTWLSLGRLLGQPRPDADLFLMTGRELRSDRTEARSGRPHPPLDDGLLTRYIRAALAAR